MLSRVAEHIYWIARNIERAECTARLINVNTFLLLDLPKGVMPEWEPLIYIMGAEQEFEEQYADYSERSVVKYLMGDHSNASSIISCLQYARENCRSIRESLPRTVWEELSQLYAFARENLQSGLARRNRHAYLNEIIRGAKLLAGTFNSSMARDEVFSFLCIGHHLERADMTTRIIDVRTSNLLPDQATELHPFENIQWMSVLDSLDAYLVYRQRWQAQVRRSQVLQFLLQDPDFPRSFLFCINALKDGLSFLPNNRTTVNAISQLEKVIKNPKVRALRQGQLHAFLDNLQMGLSSLDSRIHNTYFYHLHEPQQTLRSAS